MVTLSARPLTVSAGSKITLLSLGELALRLGLVAALPITAMIFVVQTF